MRLSLVINKIWNMETLLKQKNEFLQRASSQAKIIRKTESTSEKLTLLPVQLQSTGLAIVQSMDMNVD